MTTTSLKNQLCKIDHVLVVVTATKLLPCQNGLHCQHNKINIISIFFYLSFKIFIFKLINKINM